MLLVVDEVATVEFVLVVVTVDDDVAGFVVVDFDVNGWFIGFDEVFKVD